MAPCPRTTGRSWRAWPRGRSSPSRAWPSGYVEIRVPTGCTSAVGLIDGRAWVARNNDADFIPEAPNLWGHAVVREIDGRLPTLIFGLEGDCFGASGVNARRLWVHPDYLPDADEPGGETRLPTWIWIREALETCASVADVERLLGQLPRHGGMNLIVVDGKTEEAALFECSGRRHIRRGPIDGWLLAPNAYRAMSDPAKEEDEAADDHDRWRRLRQVLRDRPPTALPDDLVRLLADPAIEQTYPDFGTVYANVACPSRGEVWLAAGAFPAASAGTWRRIPWPWTT